MIVLLSSVSLFAYEGQFNSQGGIDNWGHYERGLQFINQKDFRMAEQEFNFYLAPANAGVLAHMAGVAYFGKGLLYQSMGRPEMAMEEFQNAIRNDRHPDYKVTDKAWMNIGTIQIKLKNYKEAQAAYEKAVAIDPKNGQAQYYLGLAALRAGNIELAEKQAAEAKKLGITYVGLEEDIAERKKNPAGESKRSAGKNKTSNNNKGKTPKAKSAAKEEQE